MEMPPEKENVTPHLAKLKELLSNFERELKSGDLRLKVRTLIPMVIELRDYGSHLIPADLAGSARERILYYFQTYPEQVIDKDELMVVSGISDWARRVRELRTQFGWHILSGQVIKNMIEEGDIPPLLNKSDFSRMKTDDYVLISADQDREAAHRWHTANSIRRETTSVKNKILHYLRENVGKQVTGEELSYLARAKSEWPRRIRELRTEEGWPIVTKQSGDPNLPVGVYVLEADRQIASHDRRIPDFTRVQVLERDDYACTRCGWVRSNWVREDPRSTLELHHIEPHAEKGSNKVENLRTLCNVCHDDVHRKTSKRHE